MLDMSWGEVMVIGAVALIVIGPKDLPKALRTLGNITGKVRRMAAEFQGQFQEAMREAELDDVKRQLQGMNETAGKGFNPIQTIRDELKGAVEAPVTPSPTVTGEAVAEVPPSGATAEPPPADPLLALEIPPAPAMPDPAETIAASLRQEAEAKAAQEVQTAPEPKPDAKA
ncbi:Sec-independent protein translocase protein TatB [Microvirga flavescens]|uniref:Sec-independent protein translocase protein TatB n=1 Tax=Microvirga flavescens TaxID=2249811 RepID=UPI000DD559EF|nr:Sec-independent protein translocase protein TatB [Microvirga flavescens]